VPDAFVPVAAVDSAADRIRVLRQLNMNLEVEQELNRIRTLAGNDAQTMLSAANSLRELGYGSRAISLAQQAQTRGAARDARLFRLLYPFSYGNLVQAEASPFGLDVNMLAGLIRQESLFNPSATSPAGARGLMQVMPALGAELSQSFRFPMWDPVLLWQPDVNARMGVRHFADLVASQKHVYHVLASYNAGVNRVTRWLAKRGAQDPEVFVERIPFVETRDYVRIVVRNSETYRAMYGR
jgi:soluble lytic murein transglycosylase